VGDGSDKVITAPFDGCDATEMRATTSVRNKRVALILLRSLDVVHIRTRTYTHTRARIRTTEIENGRLLSVCAGRRLRALKYFVSDEEAFNLEAIATSRNKPSR